MHCLEKDPAHRPASAAELLTALDAASARRWPRSVSCAAPAPGARRAAATWSSPRGVIDDAPIGDGRSRDRAARPPRRPSAAEQSLAVLPLANLSGDTADDYFGIGLAEEITRALAKNGVRVIGRVSAGALQAKGLDERAIARELGVSSLLTGTVQRAGGPDADQRDAGLGRATAPCAGPRSTTGRWRTCSRSRTRSPGPSRPPCSARLGRSPTAAAARAETADPEAHALFLQGLVLFNRRGARTLQQAIALFERAAARDPQYARAQASLAMALAVLPAYVQDSTTPLVTSAVAAAERAIAMDSTIAESYAALGYALLAAGRAGAGPRRASAAPWRSTPRWPRPGAGTGCSPTGWATTGPRTTGWRGRGRSSRPR